jgi:uncharacterized protein
MYKRPQLSNTGQISRASIIETSSPTSVCQRVLFFDCALVHLLTTAALDRLRELYPQERFEVRRFRPNFMVETPSGQRDFVENPCPRCVMTTLPQGDLPKDPGILRAAARHNRANVGIYASVLQGGTVRRGDSVRLESAHA